MAFDFWTVLLIASASQCLLLIVFFVARPITNKPARNILIALLFTVLLINISNIISASYLYRSYPEIAGFARGMVLLLGPLLYLYTKALIQPGFRFKSIQLLHFLPYVLAFTIIKIQEGRVSNEVFVAAIDALMEGNVRMDAWANLWFVSYFVHLLVYIGISHNVLRQSITAATDQYLISVDERVRWLRRIGFQFILIATLFLGITAYCAVIGFYSITGNFIYTLVLAILVYIIAYQTIGNHELLTPGFSAKYGALKLDKKLQRNLLRKLLHLFETEKIFTNPDLKISTLAEQLDTPPHLVSQLINTELNQSFSELLNDYRIREFKSRISQPEYQHYSIMGVAYEVGYNSKSTFNTVFKKQTGMTPSEYMRNNANN